MNWLAASIVLSVVLTVGLNLAIRLFPGAAERSARRLDEWVETQKATEFGDGEDKVRVIVPWKAMLIVSIGLTLVLNVLLRLG